MERLSGLPGALRQTLDDSLWQSIAEDNYESNYSAALATGVPLYCNPKTSNIFRVEAFVCVIPAGATGVLQLGDATIPISAGGKSQNGLRLQLAQSDIRAVTIAGNSGPTSLLLTGQQLPTYGVQTR